MGRTVQQSILVVEDNPVVQATIVAVLEEKYQVRVAENGTDALTLCRLMAPDLILLDIEMPGINGYETCRRIRETSLLPILFVSSRDSLEERLLAFEAGGDDFLAKPFDGQILSIKVERMLAPHQRLQELTLEKRAMQQMALDLLQINGENRTLLDFLKQNLDCQHYDDLGNNLKRVLENFGLHCHIRIRHPEGIIKLSTSVCLTALEEALLDKCDGPTGIFVYKQRLLIKHPSISLFVPDLPDDENAVSRFKSNLVALAEATESLIQSVVARRNATLTTENLQVAALSAHESTSHLQADYHRQRSDTQHLLHGLIEKIESSYFSLGLSEAQEERISGLLREETEAVMALFQKVGEEFDAKFAEIMNSLAPPRDNPGDVWL